jgi:hypothetical protein
MLTMVFFEKKSFVVNHCLLAILLFNFIGVIIKQSKKNFVYCM